MQHGKFVKLILEKLPEYSVKSHETIEIYFKEFEEISELPERSDSMKFHYSITELRSEDSEFI